MKRLIVVLVIAIAMLMVNVTPSIAQTTSPDGHGGSGHNVWYFRSCAAPYHMRLTARFYGHVQFVWSPRPKVYKFSRTYVTRTVDFREVTPDKNFFVAVEQRYLDDPGEWVMWAHPRCVIDAR